MTRIRSNAPVPPFAGREIAELAAKGDAPSIANCHRNYLRTWCFMYWETAMLMYDRASSAGSRSQRCSRTRCRARLRNSLYFSDNDVDHAKAESKPARPVAAP